VTTGLCRVGKEKKLELKKAATIQSGEKEGKQKVKTLTRNSTGKWLSGLDKKQSERGEKGNSGQEKGSRR